MYPSMMLYSYMLTTLILAKSNANTLRLPLVTDLNQTQTSTGQILNSFGNPLSGNVPKLSEVKCYTALDPGRPTTPAIVEANCLYIMYRMLIEPGFLSENTFNSQSALPLVLAFGSCGIIFDRLAWFSVNTFSLALVTHASAMVGTQCLRSQYGFQGGRVDIAGKTAKEDGFFVKISHSAGAADLASMVGNGTLIQIAADGQEGGLSSGGFQAGNATVGSST